jgi:uncharacterized ferritin-like protein (DUF455 family)
MDRRDEQPSVATLESWAEGYVLSSSLAYKLAPPPVPERSSPGPAMRIAAPGRPPELKVTSRAKKAPKGGALVRPLKRAELFHTFLHHELQAAELMCWAIVAFPDTPEPFRRGLARIAMDEVRHMQRYAEHIARLGASVGTFEVRDWFWERVPRVESAAAFVALVGVGLEGGNLDHSERYAALLRAAGDEEGARIVDEVGTEEIAHVRFAVHWLERFDGPLEYGRWSELLPPPISPVLLRGDPMQRAAREKAGLTNAFMDRLAAARLDRAPV